VYKLHIANFKFEILASFTVGVHKALPNYPKVPYVTFVTGMMPSIVDEHHIYEKG
jgi:hypothetical protein